MTGVRWFAASSVSILFALFAQRWPWMEVAAWLVLAAGASGPVWSRWRDSLLWAPVAGLSPILLVGACILTGVGLGAADLVWAGPEMIRNLGTEAAGQAQLRVAGPDTVGRVQVALALTSPIYGFFPGLAAVAWARSAPLGLAQVSLVGISSIIHGFHGGPWGALEGACWGLLAAGWTGVGLLPGAACLGALHGLGGLAPSLVEPSGLWGERGPLALSLAGLLGVLLGAARGRPGAR
jgi:hypothetical protein